MIAWIVPRFLGSSRWTSKTQSRGKSLILARVLMASDSTTITQGVKWVDDEARVGGGFSLEWLRRARGLTFVASPLAPSLRRFASNWSCPLVHLLPFIIFSPLPFGCFLTVRECAN
jgi:hypothetical protein